MDTFIDALRDYLQQHPDIGFVVPIGDREITAFDCNRDRLPSGVHYMMASPRALRVCRDKPVMLALAKELGIPQADYRAVSSGGIHHSPHGGLPTGPPGNPCHDPCSALLNAATAIGFPCIVKAVTEAHRVYGRKALIVPDREFLAGLLSERGEPGGELIVQAYVDGERHGIYFFASGGNVLAAAQFRINRTDRLDGTGYAVDGESVPLSAEWLRHLERLVDRIGYHGAGCLQFLRDPGRGTETFLEINARLGGNHAGIESIGMPLPHWWLQSLQGNGSAIPRPFTYPLRVRYSWFFGDVSGWIAALRARELNVSSAIRWGLRLPGTLLGSRHITWSLQDPRPSLYLYAGLAKRLLKGTHRVDARE